MEKNNYDDINFDMFVADDNDEITELEKDNLKANFYESAGLKRTAPTRTRTIRGFSRKFVAVAAAMIMVLAFGAVAYATDMFGLGIINHEWGKTETAYEEDSEQYKALEEYSMYLNELSDDEYSDIVHTEDGTINPKNTKLKEILKKYNLVYPDQSKITYSESADEMFKKAGIPNFLGNAKGYKQNNEDYDVTYVNYDVGKIEIGANLDPSLHHDKNNPRLFIPEIYRVDDWQIQCLEKNVFPENSESPWSWSYDGNGNDSFAKWIYETKDGVNVFCTGAVENSSVSYDKLDGTPGESPITYNDYNMIATFDNYTVLLHYMVTTDPNTEEISKGIFENFINEIEFSKLK